MCFVVVVVVVVVVVTGVMPRLGTGVETGIRNQMS